jgi:hypothetical protein
MERRKSGSITKKDKTMPTEEQLKKCADEITKAMWNAFGPEVEAAFYRKLVAVASEKWRYRWEHEETISKMINDAVSDLLKTTFKPALEKIAHEKARAQVKARAEKNRVNLDEFDLFAKMEPPEVKS